MNVIGNVNKDEYNREEARRIAARVVKKRHPLMSQRKTERLVAKEEKKQHKKRGIGL